RRTCPVPQHPRRQEMGDGLRYSWYDARIEDSWCIRSHHHLCTLPRRPTNIWRIASDRLIELTEIERAKRDQDDSCETEYENQTKSFRLSLSFAGPVDS